MGAKGATLYGVHVTDAYNETEHIVSTVSIDTETGTNHTLPLFPSFLLYDI
jgi:hypothetical protein